MENIDNQLKPSDTFKYNLRCNRNISEKMTKKDFIYDIPAPFQAVRRVSRDFHTPENISRRETGRKLIHTEAKIVFSILRPQLEAAKIIPPLSLDIVIIPGSAASRLEIRKYVFANT